MQRQRRARTVSSLGVWRAREHGNALAARTPAVIVSMAHLDDEERGLVLGVLFAELLAWVRTRSGTSELRALRNAGVCAGGEIRVARGNAEGE